MNTLPKVSLAIATLLLMTSISHSATLSVGTGAGCSHTTIQAALDSASGNSAGPHLIKLGTGHYFPPIYPGQAFPAVFSLLIQDPAADITIEGGYASCSDSQPGAAARATIHAPTGSGILQVYNANTNPRRTIELSSLTLTGAQYEGSSGFGTIGYGGAVGSRGKLTLKLSGGTEISVNTADFGGGISVMNLDAAVPEDYAKLIVYQNSQVLGNTANGYSGSTPFSGETGRGGGIFAGPNSVTKLWSGKLNGNQANKGGGLYLSDESASLEVYTGTIEPFEISTNEAVVAPDGFGGEIPGFGGGIYSRLADIDTLSHQGGFNLVMANNEADRGGAIYVSGDQTAVGNFTFISLETTLLESNVARDSGGAMYSVGAVDWVLDSGSNTPCTHPVLGEISCSLAYDNRSLGQGIANLGAAVIFVSAGTSDAHRGIARIRRTAMIENQALGGGSVAVAMADMNGELFFERSILAGNVESAADGVLMRSFGPTRCNYCTITGNDVENIYFYLGTTLILQGSIIWNPGADILLSAGTTVATNECLIAHTSTGITGGVTVIDPELDANFRPTVPSAALDFCDNLGYTAIPDVYNKASVDVAGIENQPYGINDLGAIELVDVIFFGGFGERPTF